MSGSRYQRRAYRTQFRKVRYSQSDLGLFQDINWVFFYKSITYTCKHENHASVDSYVHPHLLMTRPSDFSHISHCISSACTEGIIWEGSVPVLKCILEEILSSDFENFILIMVHYDVHKMSGSPPPLGAEVRSTHLYILYILCPHVLWLFNTLIFFWCFIMCMCCDLVLGCNRKFWGKSTWHTNWIEFTVHKNVFTYFQHDASVHRWINTSVILKLNQLKVKINYTLYTVLCVDFRRWLWYFTIAAVHIFWADSQIAASVNNFKSPCEGQEV